MSITKVALALAAVSALAACGSPEPEEIVIVEPTPIVVEEPTGKF